MDLFQTRYEWWLKIGYGAERAFDCAREETYYEEHGELPPDHYVIDRVEIVNDMRIFVHSDPSGQDYH